MGRPEFNLAEASAMLETLSLTSFFRGDYIIVTRPGVQFNRHLEFWVQVWDNLTTRALQNQT